MADRNKGSHGGDKSGHPGDPVVVERVRELTWSLVDEQITDDEMRLLDNLLLSDDTARNSYIGCIQLHIDLMAHFAAPTAKPAAATHSTKSPILGFLNSGMPPIGLDSPTEEATS